MVEIILLHSNPIIFKTNIEIIRSQRGYKFFTFDSVDLAYDSIARKKYDLLISDNIIAPGRYTDEKNPRGLNTGKMFWKDIRFNSELALNRRIPIIALVTDPFSETHYLDDGANLVLGYPVLPSELLAGIDKLLR
jgi:hypothetical protein